MVTFNNRIPKKLKLINDELTKPWNKKIMHSSFTNEASPNKSFCNLSPQIETIRQDHKELKSLIKSDTKTISNQSFYLFRNKTNNSNIFKPV